MEERDRWVPETGETTRARGERLIDTAAVGVSRARRAAVRLRSKGIPDNLTGWVGDVADTLGGISETPATRLAAGALDAGGTPKRLLTDGGTDRDADEAISWTTELDAGQQALAVCAVADEWPAEAIAEMSVTTTTETQYSATRYTFRVTRTEPTFKTKLRSPGCSRCNGTGTVFHGEERRCPGCTEEYTALEEKTVKERALEREEIDPPEYDEGLSEFINDAAIATSTGTIQLTGAERDAAIEKVDPGEEGEIEAVERLGGEHSVSVGEYAFECDEYAVACLRANANYHIKYKPELEEPEGFLSRFRSSGPRVTARGKPERKHQIKEHLVAETLECDACGGVLAGVVDDDIPVNGIGNIHGVCLSCGTRLMNTGEVERRSFHHGVTSDPDEFRQTVRDHLEDHQSNAH